MRRIWAVAYLLTTVLSASIANAGEMHPVDLSDHFNQRLDGAFGRAGQGNNLANMPRGRQKLGDATFHIGDGMLQLGSQTLNSFPKRINGIAVNRSAAKLHFVHATLYGGIYKSVKQPDIAVEDDYQIGHYLITYVDGSTVEVPIIYGRDVRDWWYTPGNSDPPSVGKVAWQGTNGWADGVARGIRVYSSEWTNPHPEKSIKSIDYVGRKNETVAAPFCLAISTEDADVNKDSAGTSSSPANAPKAP